MKAYLWRHGHAEKVSPSGRDEDRALSPEGRNDLIDMADFLFGPDKKSKPEKILSSPCARARESAETLQGFLGCREGLTVLPQLSSGTATEDLAVALAPACRGLDSVILVGHVPDLERLAARIIQGEPGYKLAAGGLLEIELSGWEGPCQGKLLSSLNPQDLSR